MPDIKNPALAAAGRERIIWVAREMPVLRRLSEDPTRTGQTTTRD